MMMYEDDFLEAAYEDRYETDLDLEPYAYDLDEQLGYDADHSDPRQFCRHGTFIGSSWGPDYMCGYCESGEEPPTPEEFLAAAVAGWRKRINEAEEMIQIVAQVYSDNGIAWKAKWAHALTNELFEPHTDWEYARQAVLAYENLVSHGVDPWGQ